MAVYLLVIQLASGDNYLELSEDFHIKASKDMNEITERFESFYSKAGSGDYETHMSACWGILSFRPFVIKSPGEDADVEWLKEYILDMHPQKISGGNVQIPYPMLKVDQKILEHSILDIAKNVIDVVYGRDV